MPEKTPWNPSRKAIARVPEPHLPAPSECPYCEHHVSIKHHDDIYGRSYGDWSWMYVCDMCGARVGMHPFTAIPLGTLADQKLREARKTCKLPFEQLWRGGQMTRAEAYSWLADQLGISVEQCHFGLFDIETCERAREACKGAAT
jgi:hypothetical protein